jgi:hypothetical protein
VTERAREQSRGVDGISARVAAWLAWSLCLMSVPLAAASLILALLNGRTLDDIFLGRGAPPIAHLAIIAVSFSVVGALIASQHPKNSIGWIFLAVGFVYGLLSAGEEYAVYALLTNPGTLPLGGEASWLGQWIWAPALVRGSGVSFSRWCSCGVLSLTVYSSVWVEGIRLLSTVLVKRWNWCKFLCKNFWGGAPPYSEGLAFLGTPHPLPCVVIPYSVNAWIVPLACNARARARAAARARSS